MAGERVLELCDALLEAHDLLPQPISLGRDRNDAFSHLRDVVLPAKSFTALSLDSTVGAHPLRVGSPLARPAGTVLSHSHHFRTFVYPPTHSHHPGRGVIRGRRALLLGAVVGRADRPRIIRQGVGVRLLAGGWSPV